MSQTYDTAGETPAVIDLEHGTIRPVGTDPNHCASCAHVAAYRQRQAECDHPAESVETVEINEAAFGHAASVLVRRWCGLCGKPAEEGNK